ncbi:MAG: hypothetical protein WC277_04440 [Bacilli bacterium]|jgi:hypothetical protein
MHEYLDLAAETGYFDDPRILYDLTPAEIAVAIVGKSNRDRQQQQLENIRAGTVCATIFNQHRTKRSDPILTWKDFFPDTSVKPAQPPGEMKHRCKEIALIFGGTVTTHGT